MTKIKDMHKVDLPREKLEKYGAAKLADHELLAILLGSGIKGLNVVELSKRILKKIRKDGLAHVTLDKLLKERGLGKAKALQIIAILDLGRRLQTEERQEVLSPKSVRELCLDIRDSKREHFVAFYINTQGQLIERRIISIGTLNASLVHPREVFEPAVLLHANSIIVAHNHPSGNPEPSTEDNEVTKRLDHAGKILGIRLLDHVIVTKDSFLSMKERGTIE